MQKKRRHPLLSDLYQKWRSEPFLNRSLPAELVHVEYENRLMYLPLDQPVGLLVSIA
jgi:hypothetical protein